MGDWKRNIPNILTVIRIIFVPLVVYFICEGAMLTGFILFALAMFTDVCDGYIARRFNYITKLGTWLDPLADKLMALAVLITFTARGIVPLFVLIIILAKELIMLCAGALLLRRGAVIPSNKYGKLAALVLNISIMLGFAYQYLYPWYLYLIYIALALAIVAFVQYALIGIEKFKETARN